MNKRVIWGCGTPNCDAGFRVHLRQTWVRLQCRVLGHDEHKTPMYHMEMAYDAYGQPDARAQNTLRIIGWKIRCRRCNTDIKEDR